jgi:glycosyltransferase involved in cell wall biosynthesis
MATKKPYPALSVLMPVLNEEFYLEAAVNAVLNQNYPGELELLLALGPSTDGTDTVAQKIAKADKRVRLIENPRGLTTVGLNKAVQETSFDFVVRVDAHSEPQPNYLTRGIEILLETKADLLGGVMAAKGKTPFQKAVAWAYTSRFGIGGASYHVGGKAGEAESAYLGIFRKSALERVGGYDEGVIRGEDWDLARRIRETGGLVWFSPELGVTYWPRSTFKHLAKQFYSTGVWRGELSRRSLRNTSKRYFVPPLAVLAQLSGLAVLVSGHVIGVIPTAFYLLFVFGIAMVSAGLPLNSRLWLVLVLPTMHIAWGLGFWVGLLRGATMATVDKSRIN